MQTVSVRTGHSPRRMLQSLQWHFRRLMYQILPGQAWWSGRGEVPDQGVPVGAVDMGSLRRVQPISGYFGFDRGNPIDRYYVERFLAGHRADVRGRVLEVDGRYYTSKFGGRRVERSDILSPDPSHPEATVIGDLTRPEQFAEGTYDCVVCTQTLQFVFDLHASVRTLYRVLKPGGVLLLTLPGISRIDTPAEGEWGEFWRFTRDGARRLFAQAFGDEAVAVESFGNVLSATTFLYGLASHELDVRELEHNDPNFQMLVGLRAVKGRDPAPA